MGIHLSVIKKDLTEHPDWDFCRHSGDRDFDNLDLPKDIYRYGADLDLWRPDDIPAWRSAVKNFPNPDRFKWVLDLIESDPQWWLYTSY